MGSYLGLAGGLLWLAMLLLEPEVGFSAPRSWMALFWALQIGFGLLVLQAVLLGLTRALGNRPWPIGWLVPASGVLGALLLAPAYWLIGEWLMVQQLGFPLVPDDDGDVLPSAAAGLAGWWAAWGSEFGDIVGPVTACWCLICLPRLHRLVPPLMTAATAPAPRIPMPVLPATDPVPTPAPSPSPTDWRSRLPAALGTDVIAVASELQYLRVWTPRGVALVLGSLAEVEAAGAGCRVHRSWWVADAHLRRVKRSADGLTCVATGNLEVPVSRRRRAEVLARYGDAATYGGSETAADPEVQ
jgi:LytTr DNA-binding domain